MARAVIMIGIAATSVAQARPINYQHHHFHANYAGPVYAKAPSELWPWNVQGRGFAGVAPQFSNRGPQIKGYGLPRPPGLRSVHPALLLTSVLVETSNLDVSWCSRAEMRNQRSLLHVAPEQKMLHRLRSSQLESYQVPNAIH
jgi:hypothetical protein